MQVISDFAFLQALGWAALNSIWQAGLLWGLLWIANYLFKPGPSIRYVFSVVCIAGNFVLFFSNITYYLHFGDSLNAIIYSSSKIYLSSNYLIAVLNSASIAYLVLLAIPVYRLHQNWLFVNKLKKVRIQKVDIEKRLFVQKMSKLLSIKHEVRLYISEMIHSPVTIGFLKPIILLPIASLNQLSLQQAEAVLLHELAHIRRFDYVVNIFIHISQTVLYFNPFHKLFVRMAESSREESCDQLVLQFGYDKVSYASALLQLEKASIQNQTFAIGATGKSPLFQRIEKITGLSSRNSSIKFTHFAGLLSTILFALLIQAVFTVSQTDKQGRPFVFSNFANPYYFIANEENPDGKKIGQSLPPKVVLNKTEASNKNGKQFRVVDQNQIEETTLPDQIIPVALNEVDASLTNEEKKQVQSTLGLVKEVLITTEWKNLKKSVPDGLTEKEKNAAYKEYLTEVKRINWKNLEQNLKADYNKINWAKLEANLQEKLECSDQDSIVLEENEQNIPVASQVKPVDSVKLVCNTPDIELPSKKHLTTERVPYNLDTLQTPRKKIIKL